MRGLRHNGTLVLLLLLGGFLLRAVVPAGYMPAGPSSGLWFELCPEQLPPGVSIASSGHDHAGHHDDSGKSAGDHCELGHMLSGASIDAPLLDVAVTAMAPETIDLLESPAYLLVRRSAHSPRGPPVL